MSPRHRNYEVVVLALNRNKAEIELTSHRFDGHAPVGAPENYCHGNGAMEVGLRPIAVRSVPRLPSRQLIGAAISEVRRPIASSRE
jgi:hypothetical protein